MWVSFFNFFCFIFYLELTLFVFLKNRHALLNQMCALFFSCFTLWSLGLVIINNPGVSEKTASLVNNITSLAWVGFAPFFLAFTLVFVGKEKLLKQKWLISLLGVVSIIFVFQQWAGRMSLIYPVKQFYGWTYNWNKSIWPHGYFVYYFSLVIFSLYQFFIFYQASKDLLKRKQAKIIIISILLVLILGTFTNVVSMQLQLYFIPPIASVLGIFWAVGLLYAVGKYKFLTITVTMAAENIIA
jgi:hypothetical protein